MSDLLSCRCMCKYSLRFVTYLFHSTRSVPISWTQYFDLYKICKLLPSVVKYNNLGHKNHMKDEHWLHHASKIWICGDVDSLSKHTLHNCKTSMITELTIQVKQNWKIVEILSTIIFPNLNTLTIIIDEILNSNLDIKPLHWNMPCIQKIVFYFQIEMFPPYLQWFPIKNIKEVRVYNKMQLHVKFPIWLFSLVCFWPKIRLSDIKILYLTNIIPDNEIYQSIFIDALRISNIHKLYIHPCSPEFACRLLSQCAGLYVYVRKDDMVHKSWKTIQYTYFPRLEECKEDCFF